MIGPQLKRIGTFQPTRQKCYPVLVEPRRNRYLMQQSLLLPTVQTVTVNGFKRRNPHILSYSRLKRRNPHILSYLRQLLIITFYRRKIKIHLSMSEKSTFESGSNAEASFLLSTQAIKFDKLSKLIEADNFRI